MATRQGFIDFSPPGLNIGTLQVLSKLKILILHRSLNRFLVLKILYPVEGNEVGANHKSFVDPQVAVTLNRRMRKRRNIAPPPPSPRVLNLPILKALRSTPMMTLRFLTVDLWCGLHALGQIL